jgi:hypothetical protein
VPCVHVCVYVCYLVCICVCVYVCAAADCPAHGRPYPRPHTGTPTHYTHPTKHTQHTAIHLAAQDGAPRGHPLAPSPPLSPKSSFTSCVFACRVSSVSDVWPHPIAHRCPHPHTHQVNPHTAYTLEATGGHSTRRERPSSLPHVPIKLLVIQVDLSMCVCDVLCRLCVQCPDPAPH